MPPFTLDAWYRYFFSTYFLWLIIGIAVALAIIPALIALQRRRALGQQVYEEAPSSHAVKQGTPTLGGLSFVAVAFLAWYWASSGYHATFFTDRLPLLFLVLAAAFIGLTDDLLNLRRRRALGLRARWKIGLLAIAAIGFVVWISPPRQACCAQEWFTGTMYMPYWAWFVLSVIAIVGAANAVNLTDGLDGLAASTVIPPLLFFSFPYLLVGAAVSGACAGFLWFNRHPARIFMGDTGSLMIGALLAGLAISAKLLLFLPIVGAVFVLEALSVIVQVISFKTTGKRIFKMSPLHHHFELVGWPEGRIVAFFAALSFVATSVVWLKSPTSIVRGLIH